MCFDLYLHNTSREHDTRHLSIINPVTGYTVYSPWQDPYPCPPCDYPHTFEPVPPPQACPFHPRCCRLERHFVCRFKDGSCQARVKYHHFVDEENGETRDTSFLSAYFGYNPSLLFLAAWFFKAGVELALADRYRSQISQRLAELAERENGQGHDMVDPAERIDLEAQFARFSYTITCSREVLGQFATLWDLNTGPGALPPRPGSDPDPGRNASLSLELGLRVDGWVQRDGSQFPWPMLIQVWPSFQAGRLPIEDDPSVVRFDPAYATQPLRFSLDPMPRQQTPHIVFNPSVPIISSVPSVPVTAEEASNITSSDMFDMPSSAFSPPVSSPPLNELHLDAVSDLIGDENNEEDESEEVELEGESEEGEVEEINTHPFEAIVDHRPHRGARKQVQAFKVRWAGDWPPDQKETWHTRSDIEERFIDEYWESLRLKNLKRGNIAKRRRLREQGGKY
ncbi:hypothetical protein F4781DRAFT_357269 [Annulohypoxylon bovei var. microspora]|nr:hypothetical protein F4781DRAFT_357269 [Annulohypoxylon bovei var. microspora]